MYGHPISGLPEIGMLSAQVGYSRLAMFETRLAALLTMRRMPPQIVRNVAAENNWRMTLVIVVERSVAGSQVQVSIAHWAWILVHFLAATTVIVMTESAATTATVATLARLMLAPRLRCNNARYCKRRPDNLTKLKAH